jgi:hypothetical protein
MVRPGNRAGRQNGSIRDRRAGAKPASAPYRLVRIACAEVSGGAQLGIRLPALTLGVTESKQVRYAKLLLDPQHVGPDRGFSNLQLGGNFLDRQPRFQQEPNLQLHHGQAFAFRGLAYTIELFNQD